MSSPDRTPFRPRFLLNPFYLLRRVREMRSFDEFRRSAANVPVLVRGLWRNALYDLKGTPRLVAARTESAYYALRGTPRLLAARAESAYYKIRGIPNFVAARAEGIHHRLDAARRAASAPSAESRAERNPPAPGASTRADAAAPAAPLSFDDRGPLSLLGAEFLRQREEIAGRFQGGKPFRHVVIDGLLDPAFCRALAAEFPPYELAAFRNDHGDLGKAVHENVAQLGATYRKLDQLLQSSEFLRLVSSVTGIPDLLFDPEYAGGGTHENLEEMELDPHVDFTIHRTTGLYRRVNLLLYLNDEWDDSWGGGLELHVNPWLPPEKNPTRTISPVFNRCVLFETSDHSWHGFRPIRLPPDKKGLTRRSIALYLYTRVKPGGFPAIPGDLTVFVDRPLPAEIRAGRTLSDQDFRVLRHAVVRRDWKLRYLYDRAITLYHEWTVSRTELVDERGKLGEAREALKRAEAEKAVLANDLRMCQVQLLECMRVIVQAEPEKPKARSPS
jgi:hypothetical protein